MAELAGKISAELDWQAGYIVGLRLSSSRPKQMGRLFEGRRTTQVSRMIPLLFSACTVGQRLGFARAVERCRGVCVTEEVALGRQLLLQLENYRELLFRLVQHWLPATPSQLKILQSLQSLVVAMRQRWGHLLEPVEPVPLSLDNRALKREQIALADQLTQWLVPLLGVAPEQLPEWLDRVTSASLFDAPLLRPLNELQERFAHIHLGSDLPSLPNWHQPKSRQILVESSAERQKQLFCATPRWQGRCCETGSYSTYRAELRGMRQQGWHELSCRYAAVLAHLSDIPEMIRVLDSAGVKPVESQGVEPEVNGLGVVQTARGQLLHRVTLVEDVITGYDIVAPTEWNHHPQGLLAIKLQGVATATASEALSLSRTMLLLADPCVEFDLRLKSGDAI
ncbi:nickel-dependent hydrogenase large subunit [Amphritea sp. 2_MG-2023]|uniref:nickel-dependent hydrogenase large subunit n=1 Tax=Amphritea TaxID=515417 RepID=UPI001C06CE30|nr:MULTISPECIES: nickel-dependent hydrogenase large subunit [Amphritea]MBU2966407.1 nickel-dependent hydrogenase large subunit [Amphritea atlantica]MDO6419845.1 nickel-dependent hydrogenase large subunit [Amphritea sp. 2_MG-2023]